MLGRRQESEALEGFIDMAVSQDPSPCNACGACCSYSAGWPRFTTEDDLALERLPRELVDASLSGMRCDGARCSALVGQVGVSTSCAVYADRPDVCRACDVGDDACQMARGRHGLPLIAAA
jgi:Fe-S-cluster containining protein